MLTDRRHLTFAVVYFPPHEELDYPHSGLCQAYPDLLSLNDLLQARIASTQAVSPGDFYILAREFMFEVDECRLHKPNEMIQFFREEGKSTNWIFRGGALGCRG